MDFNKLPALSFLGNAVSEQCEAVLFDIGREMRKIQLVKSLVQKIEVSADKRIRIVFGFQDVFTELGKESAET